MLQTFREHSGGVLVKILFGILVASFAMWGIGDVFRSYTATRPVATVGELKISQEEFLHSYQRAISQLQTLAKGKLKPEEIKSMKIQDKILGEMVNNAVLDNEIKHLGLVVSDATIASFVKSMPAFANDKGQFDRNQFTYLISNSGLTESGFIHQSRSMLMKQQLIGTLAAGIRMPKVYEDTIFRALEQKRIFDVVYIPLSHFKIEGTPTENELNEIYKQNPETFTKPEYRKITLIIADPKAEQDNVKVDDARVREEYERRKGEFVVPERRDITQISFTTSGNAEKAHAAMSRGDTPLQAAKEFSGKMQSLPNATREKLTTSQAEEVFALPSGKFTKVIESAFGWNIFLVTKITPEQPKPFDEVKTKISEDLKSTLSGDVLNELRNKIEDGLAGGTPPAELSKQLGLKMVIIEETDRTGKSSSKAKVLPEAYEHLILDNAFTIEEGSDSPVMDGQKGEMVAIHIDKVTPEHIPELSAIRSQVVGQWTMTRQQEKAAELAQKMVKEIKSVTALREAASKSGLTMRTMPAMSRTDMENNKVKDDVITAHVLRQGFGLSKDQAAYAPAPGGFAVIMQEKALPMDTSSKAEQEKLKKFDESFKGMIQRDFQDQYIQYLKARIKPSINDHLVNSLINRE